MSFLRPEIKLWLYKWRECLISFIIAMLGLWMAFHGASKYNLILQFSGYIIAITGICITIAAYRRVSFSQFPNGLGLVEIRERQIVYFDPSGGIAFSADNIISIEINISSTSGPSWRLKTEDQSMVNIPLNAFGNEKLFDIFLTLPGVESSHLINAANNPKSTPKKIWEK
jgi:hypothetical protein